MTLEITDLRVSLGKRSYPITIAPGLLEDSALLQRSIVGEQVLIVTNETVAPIYLDRITAQLEGKQLGYVILPDGEKFKRLSTVQTIYDKLLQERHNRTTTLVALGGGVVGDMTGFAAATYQRGVSFVQIPTTLLAQVDSSVGGKTGVNHPLGKNMIGAFHQPVAVIIDTKTLDTLPQREFQAGLAEVIKYGLICDAEFFAWLETNIHLLMERDATALQYAIARSCENKAKIVEADERESGVRAILNFGHTFGHAIETATQYEAWLHGEAVGFGMIMALDLSCRLGYLSTQDCARAEALIKLANLPLSPPAGLPSTQGMIDLLGLDKKVMNGQLRLIMLRSLGDAFVTADFDMNCLEQTLNACLARTT